MKIKKCDKCGKTYDPFKHANGTITMKVYDSNHTSWCAPDVYDYCPACMQKIEKLILKVLENSKNDN